MTIVIRRAARALAVSGTIVVGACLATALAEQPPTAKEPGALEEIVVTAERRSESLETVPLSMSALTGDALVASGTLSLLDLAKSVPGLHAEQGVGAAQTRFYLRGIGSNDYLPSAPPVVSVAIDDVFLNSSYHNGFDLYDVDRIEILKGPQGTLWGINTTGGVISVISRAPSQETSGYARVEYGNYDRRIAEAAFGGSIIDGMLSGRVSVRTNSFDGYFWNDRNGNRTGASRASSARFQLLWTPSANVDLLLKYSNQSINDQIVYNHVGIFTGGVDSHGFRESADPFHANLNTFPDTTIRGDNFTAKLIYRFGDGNELVNIAGYLRTHNYLFADDDVSPFQEEVTNIYAHPVQLSDELRLSSSSTHRLSWIVGAFYLHEDMDAYYLVYNPSFNPDGTSLPSFTQTSRSTAAYGSFTFHIDDRWTTSAGIRVSEDSKDSHVVGAYYTSDSVEFWNRNLLTDRFQYIDAMQSLKNTMPTWDANLKYQFANDWIGYARIAKGMHAGTINNFPFDAKTYYQTRPEELIAYEGGAKGHVFDRSLYLELAAFYYDFRNKQVFQLIGATSVLSNAKAEVKGVEFTARWRPSARVEAGLSATIMDPKYTSFPNAAVPTVLEPSGVTDLSGRQFANTAKTSGDVYLSWETPLSAKSKLTLRADWYYTSKYFGRDEAANLAQYTPPPNVDPAKLYQGYYQDAYSLGDVRATLSVGSHMHFSGYVRNVTDKTYMIATYLLGYNGNFGRILGAPRTFGLDFEYDL